MRASSQRRLTGVWIAALCIVGIPNKLVSAQSRTAQVMILPDPTPREPDLEKRFKTSSPAPGPDGAARLAAYNRQRFQLIGQASAHMHSLATVLQAAVAQHREASSLPQEARLAGAIESLAGNVYTAMAITPSQASPKKEEGASAVPTNVEPAQLDAEAKQLAAMTEALQAEVSRSSADALAVGVLIKSAQVKDLAHNLKLQLQPEQALPR